MTSSSTTPYKSKAATAFLTEDLCAHTHIEFIWEVISQGHKLFMNNNNAAVLQNEKEGNGFFIVSISRLNAAAAAHLSFFYATMMPANLATQRRGG